MENVAATYKQRGQ